VDHAGNSVLINGYNGTTLPDTGLTNFTVINESGDSTPPALENIDVSPKQLKVGETVTINATIRDDSSGVKSAFIGYNSPSGSRTQGIRLNYNSGTGLWEGKYTIQSTDEQGTWSIYWIELVDHAGNSVLINGYNGTTLPDSSLTTFTVINESWDAAPPALENIDVSPKQLKVGDTVTISAQIRDDVSGVKSGYIGYRTPSGNRTQGIRLTYNSVTESWEGKYTIQSTDEQGTWSIYWIELVDHAGNSVLINGYNGTTLPDTGLTSFTIINESVDLTPPSIPSVNEVTDKSTGITGKGEVGSTITVKDESSTVLGTAVTKDDGTFIVPITLQKAGTKLSVTSTDQAGNVSDAAFVEIKIYYASVKVQLNGKDFTGGFYGGGTTYVHWKALSYFKIPFSYKGDVDFIIAGKAVKGKHINGGLYIRWSDLAPGKVTFKAISGGFNFIYAIPVRVQLNGNDFTQGYFKNGTTYVHWSALKVFKIPYTFKGGLLFEIGGRTVLAEKINGAIYIRWSNLDPGNITYHTISGGYNFIYKP
jgi:hypothetical protein